MFSALLLACMLSALLAAISPMQIYVVAPPCIIIDIPQVYFLLYTNTSEITKFKKPEKKVLTDHISHCIYLWFY
jgi:hypothetical protein